MPVWGLLQELTFIASLRAWGPFATEQHCKGQQELHFSFFLKKKGGGWSQMAWISPNRIIYGSKSLYPSGKDRKASSPEEWLWKRNTMCSIVITFKICKSSSAYEKYLPAVIFTLSLLIKQRNPSYTVVSELFHVRRWRNFLNIFSLTVMHSQLEESEWVTSSELHHPLQHL